MEGNTPTKIKDEFIAVLILILNPVVAEPSNSSWASHISQEERWRLSVLYGLPQVKCHNSLR